jgi:glucose-6-phosphate 1-dehydrogenase
MNTLIVLGSTGDLAGRLLLPSIAALRASGSLGRDFQLIGVGQQDWSAEEFAAHARADRAEVTYRQADVTKPVEVAAVLDFVRDEVTTGPVAVYLALPTQLLLVALQALQSHGLPSGSRVAVEKPLGYDSRSAVELNAVLALLGGSHDESSIYRVDHALAMTVVQNLPQACYPGTDRRIEWDSRRIERVDLLFEETLALEGRASFYDRAGALRDVVQNHLLQILCTIAQPYPNDGNAVATEAERRAAVLRAVRPLSDQAVRTSTRRARYSAGRLAVGGGADGRLVPDYRAEAGVVPGRHTETFAEVVLQIDTPQWLGTRFVLRAGKALDARRRGVLVTFHQNEAQNPVWLDIDQTSDAAEVAAEPAAYQRIVADLLSGGSAFSVDAEEAELAWGILMPVLQGWAADKVPLETYPAGSRGPS